MATIRVKNKNGQWEQVPILGSYTAVNLATTKAQEVSNTASIVATQAQEVSNTASIVATQAQEVSNTASIVATQAQEVATNTQIVVEKASQVPDMVNKNQGAENAGKVLQVGTDGLVTLAGGGGHSIVEELPSIAEAEDNVVYFIEETDVEDIDVDKLVNDVSNLQNNMVEVNKGIVPCGTSIPFTGTGDIPVGYLLCNGASVLRATYPSLFSVIGTTYGAEDGNHFNLPNLSFSESQSSVKYIIKAFKGINPNTKDIEITNLANEVNLLSNGKLNLTGGTLTGYLNFKKSDNNNRIVAYTTESTEFARNVMAYYPTSSKAKINYMQVLKSDNTPATIGLLVNSDDSIETICPTPSTSDNSTKIATTAYVRNSSVAKSGDTITGDITMSNGVLKKASANGEMILFGGSTSANGAYLALRGLNHTDNGDFVLLANNGTSTTSLIGNANGELSWAGNVIPTQRKLVNSARASKFTIGKLHIEQGTYVLNATTTYADITFSNAFSSTPAILFGNEDAVAGTPMCTNLSATGFRLKQNVDGVARINWCAIGYRA